MKTSHDGFAAAGDPRKPMKESEMNDATDNGKYMRRAIALSQEAISRGSGPPFGAVIVRDGKIIAEGFNHVHAHNDPTAHAEIVAIREACRMSGSPFLAGCTTYSSSEPCPMCMSAIYWSRISTVYFATDREAAAKAGFDDRALYAELQQPIEKRHIPMVKMLSAEGQATFDILQGDAHVAVQTRLGEIVS
jgi:guanine deaminase